MNRNNQNPNNQNFDNQNYNNQNFDNSEYTNQSYDPNFTNPQHNGGYDQQYQNAQYQNFNQQQNYNDQQQNYNDQQQNYNDQQQNYNDQQQNFNNQPNYNVPPMYMEEPKEKKKSILPVVLTAIVTLVVLVVALYFGYNKFLKKENVIDLATYEVNFVAYGAEGEGKPEADIKKVPEVANSNAEISNLLSNPDISFNKQSNLKNGDKVEVTITLNKNTLNKLKLKTTGEFKRTFTVNGLNEKAKEKETIIVKEGASGSSSSSKRRSDERTVYVKPSAGVNLRSSSNDSSNVITSIKVGSSVYQHYIEVNSDGEAWAYVSYGSRDGWIRADLIG